MRCERGSVGAVLPASSRERAKEAGGSRHPLIGLDIHRAIAEAVADDGKLRRLGRVDMRCERRPPRRATFAGRRVVVRRPAMPQLLRPSSAPRGGRLYRNPKQVSFIAHARIKTCDRDGVLARSRRGLRRSGSRISNRPAPPDDGCAQISPVVAGQARTAPEPVPRRSGRKLRKRDNPAKIGESNENILFRHLSYHHT